MNSPFRLFSLTAIAATCALLMGCGSKESSGKVRIAFVTNASADFWTYAEAGAKKAQAEFDDIEVEWQVGDGSSGKQREICEALLVRGVKGIAISPTSPKGQTDMINDWASKAKVLTVDSDAPDTDRLFYLGTDNVAAGRKAGELLKEALPEGGKVMAFVGLGDAQNAVERYQGLREAVAGAKKIEILDLRTDEGKHDVARRNAEDTLTNHQDIAGMVGLWTYNAPMILEALRDKGLVGKVQVVAFDEDPRTLKAIDTGEIFGTVVQKPYEFGYESIKALRAMIVEGKSSADLGVGDDKLWFFDTLAIKKGEGEAYLEKCKAWKALIK